MTLTEIHKVPNLKSPVRLQEYGIGIFETKPTRSSFKKAIKKGVVFVNKNVATTALFISGGETIELFQATNNHKEFNLDLKVVFEDDFLAIIEKPAGIKVNGNSFATIDNALTKNLKPSSQKDATRPRPVHRLDYPTSGLLLVGKTNSCIIALNKLFESKEISKTYHAVTIGYMTLKGMISLDIDAKKALTKYVILHTLTSERFGFLNLVKLHPKTGRKHQLRKHLLANGTPILGDKEYFIENLILKGKGLYLHASGLEFTHPVTQKDLSITCNLPKKFNKIFNHYSF